jgi:hypothetical protein
MNKLKIALMACVAAAPLPAFAEVTPPAPPPPLGLFEVLEGVATVNFQVAVPANPATSPPTAAKAAALSANDAGFGIGDDGESIIGYKVSNTGTTTITPAVPENPATVEIEAKPAVATTAITETDVQLNSAGVTFSKLTGTSTCDLNAQATACSSGTSATDVTALVGSTAVTADGVTVKAGQKTVSLASTGLNNGDNVLAGVAAGVADTDAANFGQLKAARTDLTAVRNDLTAETNSRNAALTAVRSDLTAVRNDLTAETNSRIAADGVLRDQIASSTATAIALGGAVILPDVKFSLSGNVGFYQGATAIAVNAAARVAPNTYLTGAFGGGLSKYGDVGGRVGFAIGF